METTVVDNYEISWVSDNYLKFKIKKKDGTGVLDDFNMNDVYSGLRNSFDMNICSIVDDDQVTTNHHEETNNFDEVNESDGMEIDLNNNNNNNNYQYSANTFLGTRQENQDSYFHKYFEAFNIKVIGVFDGHGDGNASKPTTDIICKYLNTQFSNSLVEANNIKFFNNCIINSFNKANEYLLQDKDSDYGTTATLGFITDQNKVVLGWVGDSTAVIFRQQGNGYNGEILTRDHKPEDSAEKERIISSGGRIVYRYGSYRVIPKQGVYSIDEIKKKKLALNMSRALGHTVLHKYGVSPIPDLIETNINQGDILIIASDGLWNVLDLDQISKLLVKFVNNNNNGNSNNNNNGAGINELSNYLIDIVDKKCKSQSSQCDNVTICCYKH